MTTTIRMVLGSILVTAIALAFLVAPNVAMGGVLGGSVPWAYYRSAAVTG